MIKYLCLIIFCASQVYGASTENYNVIEDKAERLTKLMFEKLDAILIENQQINKDLLLISKRLEDQRKSLEVVKTENYDKLELDSPLKPQQCPANNEWLVIQRRQDGSVDFSRKWSQYKRGFGDPNGEFFIGLQKLHVLTNYGAPQELWIVLKDFENKTRYAIYDKFVIGSEAEKYALKELGHYSGDAGDSLTHHVGNIFSTQYQDDNICAERFEGGWWYKTTTVLDYCYRSNLNGKYLKGQNPIGGVAWGEFRGWDYSLKFVEMRLRPAA